MTGRTLRRGLIALALVIGALGAVTPGASGAPAGNSIIAVFDNGTYGDTDQETALVIDDLVAGGHTVNTFDDITAADFTAALDGVDVLVFPEFDNENLIGDLSSDAIDVIASWVDGGGRVVFFGSSDPDPEINGIFGFSVVSVSDGCLGAEEEAPAARAPGGALVLAGGCDRQPTDTELGDGPASLPYINDTTLLSIASLPAGTIVPYIDNVDPDGAAVALMPYGDGMVVFLGYDWFPGLDGEGAAAARGDQLDGARAAAEGDDPGYDAWEAVLDAVVSQPVVTSADVTVAEGDTATFTVSIDGPSSQPVFVEVTTSDGTATAGDDYDAVTLTVTIAPGETSGTVDVPTSTDGTDEDDETFTLAFTTTQWGLAQGSPVTGTITDGTTTPTSSGVGGAVETPPATPTVASPSFTG